MQGIRTSSNSEAALFVLGFEVEADRGLELLEDLAVPEAFFLVGVLALALVFVFFAAGLAALSPKRPPSSSSSSSSSKMLAFFGWLQSD